MTSAETEPVQVTRFEANVLRIIRFCVQQLPTAIGVQLLNGSHPHQECMSKAAIALVKDHLCKGVVLNLTRSGAWIRDRFWHGQKAVFGRLWERRKIEEIKLSFTEDSLEFLFWLNTNSLRAQTTSWYSEHFPQSNGDYLLVFLAYRAIRADHELRQVCSQLKLFQEHALVRLFYPTDFARIKAPPAPDYSLLFQPHLIFLLEVYQSELSQQWLKMEHQKSKTTDWEQYLRDSEIQQTTLGEFLAQVERTNRKDLCRFFSSMLSTIFGNGEMSLNFWTGNLQAGGPTRIADRLQTMRAGLGTISQVQQLQKWYFHARDTSFMDEDYEISRLWLNEWERFQLGTIAKTVQRLRQEMEPFQSNS
ncbi:MAG: hypothetical protein R3B84_08730 [Zavarzinella sp.]